jgi:hypothetical protein
MRAREWARAAQPLARELDGFHPIRFGFARPHDWVAECIYAETSAFSSETFYIEAFALPLFIPSTHLYFDYGFRIGTSWQDVSPRLAAAVRASRHRLSEIASLSGLHAAASYPESNIHHAEVRLGIDLLTGDTDAFQITREIVQRWEISIEWEREVLDRCQTLLRAVDAGGPGSGIAELARRRDVTRQLLV